VWRRGRYNFKANNSSTEAPVISLTGDEVVSVAFNGTYVEQGATVSDNIETNLTVTIGGDSVVTGTAGTYTITYNVSDTAGNPATEVTRRVEVTANPNVAPVAIAPSAAIEVLEDSSNNEITLEGTDEDNDTLIYAIVDQPSYGTVTLTGNTAKYTPKANYFGEDSFTFKVNDGTVDSAEATVNIIVTDVVEIISPLKTGQTTSYDASGAEVTDDSLKDNAYYNDDKGVTPDYSRDADTNTTTDALTGLVWEDNPRNKEYVGSVDIDTFCDANEGWRIPSVSELKTLVNYSAHTPAIDSAFENAVATGNAGNYRTSNPTIGIDFDTGKIRTGDESSNRAIRCVKGTNTM